MENLKYKIIIFTLVVFLIAAIAMGVAFYLKYVNVKNSEPEIAKTSQITTENCTLTTIDELTYKVEYEKSKYLTEDESIEKTLKIGDHTVRVKTSSDLIVNGNKLFDLVWEPDIYMLDGNLIFVTGATDIRSTHVLIVNKEGELVKEIYNLDSDYSDMVIADANGTTEAGTLTINKEGFKFKGTRLTHGGAFASDYEKNDYSGEPWGEEALKRHINEPVYGTYEIKYLGNGQFGELTNTGYTLFKKSDIKTSDGVNTILENQVENNTSNTDTNDKTIVLEEDDTSGIVYSYKPKDGSKHRVPQIKIDSETAAKYNQEILSFYESFASRPIAKQYMFNYKYYINDEILSLVVSHSSEGGGLAPTRIYNININTGKEVNNTQLLAYLNISENEVISKAVESYKKAIEKLKTSGPAIYPSEEKNVDRLQNDIKGMYINDGNLCVMFIMYTGVGSEYGYEMFLNVDEATLTYAFDAILE